MTRSPTVVYLIPDAGIPVGGTKGASVHVREVALALASREAEVTVVAQRVKSAVQGCEVVALDPGPLRRGPGGEIGRIAAAEDFARRAALVIAERRPDVILERLSLFFGAGRRLAEAAGVDRVVEVNAPVAAERIRHFGLVHRSLAARREREALLGSVVVAVSEPMATWALERGAALAHVTPNGVDSVRFANGTHREAATIRRLTLGLEGMEVIGFVGSLKPWHGVNVLLSAVEALAPSRPSLRLLVVGDGPERKALEAAAARPGLAGRVIFTGAIPADEVPTYLAMFDIATAPFLPTDTFYFSPSRWWRRWRPPAPWWPRASNRLRTCWVALEYS